MCDICRNQIDVSDVFLLSLLLTNFTHCSGVSTVDFEQVNVAWEEFIALEDDEPVTVIFAIAFTYRLFMFLRAYMRY